MKNLIYLVSFIVLTTCWNQKECKQVDYTFNVLTLTWPGQFCSEKSCVIGWDSSWSRGFTIHGYWPSSDDLSYLQCFRVKGYDPYCYRNFTFSESYFPPQLKSDLKRHWPQLFKKGFLKYEWDKHGTCYLYQAKDVSKSPLADKQIYIRYFSNIVAKAKKFAGVIKKGTYSTKADLAKDLKIKQEQFIAICGKDKQLDEIRICYSGTKKDLNQYVINCKPSRDQNICKFPISLPGFK